MYALPVDIWAIGAILIEMSTKHPSFPGNSEIDELFKIFHVHGTLLRLCLHGGRTASTLLIN